MRLPAVLLISTLFATNAQATSLHGRWEGVIADPRRPWVVYLLFDQAGGRIGIEGFGELPLRDVRVDGEHVHFELPAEMDSLLFEGALGGARLTGTMSDGTAARFERAVALPRPTGRVAAWRQDLDYLSTRLLDYDRSFSPAARDEFRRSIASLRARLAQATDDEILVGISRAVALADNAHTRLRFDPTRGGAFTRRYPIRIWFFADGAYVIKAAAPYRRALGCRVVAVGGHEIAEARQQAATLFAGNDSWVDYLAPLYLSCPDVLRGLHWTRTDEVPFTLEDAHGKRFTLRLHSEPLSREVRQSESWQDISPVTAAGEPRWVDALEPASLPLYLRHPDQAYWFDYAPETGLLYFQFNRSGDDENGPSFHEFADSLVTFARAHRVERTVIDLRFNSGGNLDVAKAFFGAIDLPGRLFVVTGKCTFSAGLYHAAQLKQGTHATFVGERPADRLDFWAEGGHLVLPNSRATIGYSNGFHRYSGKDYPGNRPYYEELNVATLEPDIAAPMTAAAYFAGRDPALEAIYAPSTRSN